MNDADVPATLDAIEARARAALGARDSCEIGMLHARDFQRFALCVGDEDPAYFDLAAARAAGHPRRVVPPMYLPCVMGWRAGPPLPELRADGLAHDDLVPFAVSGARLMGAGQEVHWLRTVYEGTRVTLHRRLTQVERRQGRSGPLLMLCVEREYLDADAPPVSAPLLRVVERFIAR